MDDRLTENDFIEPKDTWAAADAAGIPKANARAQTGGLHRTGKIRPRKTIWRVVDGRRYQVQVFEKA